MTSYTSRLSFVLLSIATMMGGLASGACSSSSSNRAESSDRPEAVADSPESGRSAKELFIKGNEYLDRNEWKRAIETYEMALEQKKRWDIYLNKAIAHSAQNDFEAALNAIEQSINNGGEENPRVYYNLGNVYQNRGLYRQAIKAYRMSLAKREGLDLDTLVNIGSTLTILGQYREAHETYERAEKMAPNDPRIKHGFAVLLFLEGQHQQSIDAFNQLLSMNDEYADGYYDRAHALARENEYRAAIDSLKRFLELKPESSRTDKVQSLIEAYRDKLEDTSSSSSSSEGNASSSTSTPQ